MSREKKRYDLRNLKLATIAFAILALANFAVQIIRIIEKSYVVEFSYLAVLFIAWTMMFIASRTLSEYEPDFKAAGVVSVPGMASVVICALLLVSAISSGVGKNAHLSIGVQLSLYISFLMMVMAYWYVLRGAGKLCEGFNRAKLEKSCKNIRIPAIVILILALIAVQGAPVFSELDKYIVTGTAAALALIVQMIMINKLLTVYDAVDGKMQPGRLGDVLKDSNVTGKPKAVAKKDAKKQPTTKTTTTDKAKKDTTEKKTPAADTSTKDTTATSATATNTSAKDTSATKADETKTSETNESEKNSRADNPETTKADAEKSDATKSDTEETDATKSDTEKIDTTKSDIEETDATKSDTEETDATKSDIEETETKNDFGSGNDKEHSGELTNSDTNKEKPAAADSAEELTADNQSNNQSDNQLNTNEDNMAPTEEQSAQESDQSEEPQSEEFQSEEPQEDESADIIEEDWLRKELEENQQTELETAFFPDSDIKVHTETK